VRTYGPPVTSSRRLAALLGTVAVALGVSAVLAPTPSSAGVTRSVVSAAVSSAVAPVAATRDDGPRPVGRWRVDDLGGGRYAVAWTSPTRLPVNSDRPTVVGDDLAFGPSTVGADGRTVGAVVTARSAPDPADLDVVLSGDRLDEAGSDPARGAGGVVQAAPRRAPIEAPDPGVAGPYATVTSDYDLPGVKVAGMREPIEMVGHVVEPAPDQETGPRPLVLFLHGRHEVCYDPGNPERFTDRWPCPGAFLEIPSHLGYDYLQRLLASQGYATVSVRVNGINAQDFRLDDGGADARARIVREHLDHWTTLAAEHQVDLSQVVLVGHSRGGEGVDRASIEIPLSAPYRVVGQVLLAPTDFASHTAPYVPTVTVLPYCDGDVVDIQGQKFTDTGRDLVGDDTSLKSSVLVMGANHNFFNTEWTPGTAAAPSGDDWGGEAAEPCGRRHPDRLKAVQQRGVARAYVAGAVRMFAGDDGYLPLFDGSAASVPSTATYDVRSHALGGGRDHRRPGVDATPTAPGGDADTRLCTGLATFRPSPISACGRSITDQFTPHWATSGEAQPRRSFLELSWDEPGASGGLRFDRPLDLSSDRLELRTIVDPRRGPVDLQVRLTDGSGASVVVDPVGGRTLRPLLAAPYLTKLWAQPLLVDATAATGVDLTDVRSVELLAGDPRGRVWVADLAAAPPALAPVPESRLPQVQLGRLRIDEGDPTSGRQQAKVARVPFTITGTLTRPGRFVVLTAGQRVGEVERITVDVAPGQTSGFVPVRYVVNDVDDHDATTSVAAWPVRGLATDAYLGSFTVVDDDPTPQARVGVPRRVQEGTPITVRVELSEPVGYDLLAYLQTRPGPGRKLTGADVPRRFLRRFAEDPDLALPLHRLYVSASDEIPAGRRAATLVIPTRRDGVREGPETVTVRVQAGPTKVRRTITVVD
jgi:dienelactone hydrolase